MPIVYTTPAFSRLKMENLENVADPVLVCKRTNTETFKNDGMAAQFALRILDNRVNNNIMSIIVAIDIYRLILGMWRDLGARDLARSDVSLEIWLVSRVHDDILAKYFAMFKLELYN